MIISPVGQGSGRFLADCDQGNIGEQIEEHIQKRPSAGNLCSGGGAVGLRCAWFVGMKGEDIPQQGERLPSADSSPNDRGTGFSLQLGPFCNRLEGVGGYVESLAESSQNVWTHKGNARQAAAPVARSLADEQLLGRLLGYLRQIVLQIVTALLGKRPFAFIRIGARGGGSGCCQQSHKPGNCIFHKEKEAAD